MSEAHIQRDDFPEFENRASCQDYDPEWWFPLEVAGRSRWSYQGDALKAREICSSCPALDECRAFALRYDRIAGIWGNTDWKERQQEQDRLRMTSRSFSMSYVPYMQVLQNRNSDE